MVPLKILKSSTSKPPAAKLDMYLNLRLDAIHLEHLSHAKHALCIAAAHTRSHHTAVHTAAIHAAAVTTVAAIHATTVATIHGASIHATTIATVHVLLRYSWKKRKCPSCDMSICCDIKDISLPSHLEGWLSDCHHGTHFQKCRFSWNKTKPKSQDLRMVAAHLCICYHHGTRVENDFKVMQLKKLLYHPRWFQHKAWVQVNPKLPKTVLPTGLSCGL